MHITSLVWDAETIEHVARHGVHPREIEETCRLRPLVRRSHHDRYIVLGQTDTGRYLTVIVAPLGGGRVKVITARTMSEPERRQYMRR